jgi:hypothetical protein
LIGQARAPEGWIEAKLEMIRQKKEVGWNLHVARDQGGSAKLAMA